MKPLRKAIDYQFSVHCSIALERRFSNVVLTLLTKHNADFTTWWTNNFRLTYLQQQMDQLYVKATL